VHDPDQHPQRAQPSAPGWWMLNMVDTKRRPSESRLVYLT